MTKIQQWYMYLSQMPYKVKNIYSLPMTSIGKGTISSDYWLFKMLVAKGRGMNELMKEVIFT